MLSDPSAPDGGASPARTKIGVRELRANVAQFVRRAERGERIVITIGGAPVAQLGPLDPGASRPSLDDLVHAGLADPPTNGERAPTPEPFAVPVDIGVDAILDARRGR